MKQYIVCSNCGTRITDLLDAQVPLPDDALRKGQYTIDAEGNYYIAIVDKYHLAYHPDLNRMIGCCGPSPDGLPNLLCTCKTESAREVTDCCTPHYIILYKKCIAVKQDDTGLLEKIIHLPITDDEKLQYEILLQYGDIASVLNAIRK